MITTKKFTSAASSRIDTTARAIAAVLARVEAEATKADWRDDNPKSSGFGVSGCWASAASATNVDGEAVDDVADAAFAVAVALERARGRWIGEDEA